MMHSAGAPPRRPDRSHTPSQVYPPEERIAWRDTLCHISSGMLSRAGHIMRMGSFWGTDFILYNPMLKQRTPLNALTFVEVEPTLQTRNPGV